MISILIALLLSLGVISTQDDYYNADTQTQSSYNEWIVEEDVDGN